MITLEFIANELVMIREHVLDLKRACFDRFGHTPEGYDAHVTCSNIETALATAAEQIKAAEGAA